MEELKRKYLPHEGAGQDSCVACGEDFEGVFQIGDFIFRLHCPADFLIPEHFMKFRIAEAVPGDATSIAPGDATSAAAGDALRTEPGDATSTAPGDATSTEPGDATSTVSGDATSTEPGDATSTVSGDATSTESDIYEYKVEYVEQFPAFQGQPTVQRPDILIFRTEHGEARLLGVKGNPYPYALYMEEGPRRTHVYFDRKRAVGLSVDPIFASLFALEKHMIELDSLILHCAYMEYQDGAVLFSAPSETGKTTQANLWKKYRGNETVNGDRSLLRRKRPKVKNDTQLVWTAGGWPVCGTSETCHNRDLPIRAIVMLSQSRDGRDIIEKMRPAEAFSQLYSQITINTWNPQFSMRAMDLIEELIGEVPVYHLTCTMTEEAVKVLEEKLKEH